jgi:hypothetical protein
MDIEEFFNVFELLPQTPQDLYFKKLSTGILKTALASSTDYSVEKSIQTEDLGVQDKTIQAPDD